MRTTLLLSALTLLVCVAPGCSVLVDGTLSGRGGDSGVDGGPIPTDTNPPRDAPPAVDAGPAGPCTGQPNGLHCEIPGLAEPFLCIGGVCQLSQCGDGQRDNRPGSMHDPEDCDDGNMIDGDGCDTDCTFSCTADAGCLDMETCNGMETCDTANTHRCMPGTMLADTTMCTIAGTATVAVCHGGTCRAGACPDGVLDMGEDCDDGNHTDGDGCDSDCTFSCVTDSDCQDGDPCDGVETCSAAHICQAASETLTCDPPAMCDSVACVPMTGCVTTHMYTDADNDGYHAMGPGVCDGLDCNDNNAAVHPDAQETCADTIDLNCDGVIGMPSTWYVDCDGDGYAHSTAGSVTSCNAPAPNSGCVSPGWTARVPANTTTIDCQDSASTGGNAHPGQSSYYPTAGGISPAYDWDCNGNVAHQVVLAGHPFVRTRGFVECAYTGSPFSICTGTAYWDQTTIPACGAIGTLSHCVISTGCVRVSTAGSIAACH